MFGAISIATLGWLWGVGDTYVAELFPTVLRGTGFGIAVGGGRVVSIAAPTWWAGPSRITESKRPTWLSAACGY